MTVSHCPSCGGPIEIGKGDSITLYGTITSDQHGHTTHSETRADWCPKCQREWEARLRTTWPSKSIDDIAREEGMLDDD